jgi:hypothetical protein
MDLRRCVIVEKGVYKFTNLITGRKRFSVPIYQRHYAWELKQWDDLWNDLYYLELPKTHYFGQVILMEKPSQSQYGLWFEEYEVVDGQQRLATILILLKELLKALEERGALPTEELARLKEDYLRSGSLYKLELLGDDREFFRRYIIEEELPPQGPLTPSQKRLIEAKYFFRKKLKEIEASSPKEDFKEFLVSFLTKIVTTEVMVYPLKEMAEAARIFELVNDRGKDLTNLDKTKSFLMYLAYLAAPVEEQEKILRDLSDSFANIFRLVSNTQESEFGRGIGENDLQRYHFILSASTDMLLSEPIYIEEPMKSLSLPASTIEIVMPRVEASYEYLNFLKRFFIKKYRENRKKCLTEISDYVKGLEKAFFAVKTLLTYGAKDDMANLLESIFSLKRVANFYPLLISCWLKFGDYKEYLKKILQSVEISIFRVYAIGRRRADTGRSRLYDLAYEVYSGEKGFDELITELNAFTKTYEPDERFERDLRVEDFYQRIAKSDLRYFFYWYERYLRETAKEAVEFPLSEILSYDEHGMPKYEIEHIWPEVTSKLNLNEEDSKNHRECVNKLGNLAIATKSWNSSMGNEPFDKKKTQYKESVFRSQRELALYENWGKKEIEDRTTKLVQFALTRWKIQ